MKAEDSIGERLGTERIKQASCKLYPAREPNVRLLIDKDPRGEYPAQNEIKVAEKCEEIFTIDSIDAGQTLRVLDELLEPGDHARVQAWPGLRERQLVAREFLYAHLDHGLGSIRVLREVVLCVQLIAPVPEQIKHDQVGFHARVQVGVRGRGSGHQTRRLVVAGEKPACRRFDQVLNGHQVC